MDYFNQFWNQAGALYLQTSFWLTLALTVVVWYLAALAFSHLLFGAGNREAVASARSGMWLSLLLILTSLVCLSYFLYRPADWVYALVVSLTFLVLGVLLVAIFGRLGREN